MRALTSGKSAKELAVQRDAVIKSWLRAGRGVYICMGGVGRMEAAWPAAEGSELELRQVYAGEPQTAGLLARWNGSEGSVGRGKGADRMVIYEVVPRERPREK